MCMLAGNYNKVKCKIAGCKMKVQWVEGVGNGEVHWIEVGGKVQGALGNNKVQCVEEGLLNWKLYGVGEGNVKCMERCAQEYE